MKLEDRRSRASLAVGDGARRDRAQVAVTMNALAIYPRGERGPLADGFREEVT